MSTEQRVKGKTRILFLITSLGAGGAEKQAVYLLNNLIGSHDIRVVKLLKDDYRESEVEHGIKIDCLFLNQRPIRGVLKLLYIIKEYNPDLLISFLFHGNLLSRVIQLCGYRGKVLNSFRSARIGGRIREALFRVTDISVDHIVVNTVATRDELIRKRITHKEKISVIYNGVSISEHLDNGKQNSEAEFIWINVANFSMQKDHASLIRAFSRVIQEHPSCRLILVGDGPLRDDCEIMAKQLKIDSAISFKGTRSDIQELLKTASGFVLSSRWEGLPNALLEAGAIGLPVVSTDAGGVKEIVPDDSFGRVVPKESHLDLANEMINVMRMPEYERTAMGAKLKKRIDECFAADKVMKQWDGVISQLLRQVEA